jgi:soluble lytic murein transglycosylase
MKTPNHRVPAALAAIAIAALATVSLAAPGDPLSDFKAAVTALQSGHSGPAMAALKALDKKLPKLADYVAWFLASAQFDAQEYAEVPKTLEGVWLQSPTSPLVWRAALLDARALEQTGNPQGALETLRKYYDKLPQPQGDLAMAAAFAASGDLVSAAVYDQRVYYGFPASSEAAQADSEAAKLRAQLGDGYPPALGNAMLGRDVKLLDAGQTERARKEFIALVPQLEGAERDAARVKIGVADYIAKDTGVAQRYLTALLVGSPEADAERLHYLLLCARRLNNREAMNDALYQLAQLHPNSHWRMEALLIVGDSYLLENQMDAYEPLYRACYDSFREDARAAGCHWKVAWGHYLRRRADAADLLRAHLRMFPASENAPAALYFLGRLAEASKDWPAARNYYGEVVREYPNYYYNALARDRLEAVKEVAAAPSSNASEFLRTIAFPQRARTRNFEPNATAQLRLERSRMLSAAGLDDWAEIELRYAAQYEDQPHVMGLELASVANRRAEPDQAMRYLKRYASDYLYLPLDSAPPEFWRLAFPIPYRADLERFARQNGLDPFLMAALIRQESEFNPKAVSKSNARGLTQIMPATGRELSRRLQVKAYSTARLFQPSVSLQFGSYYLKTVAASLGGRWEAALAAYNAGPAHAHAWLTWGDFQEPAEFIETVPISQTRNYVQVVLRNADVYRRLYVQGALKADARPPAAESGARLASSDRLDQPRKHASAVRAR